MDVLYMYDPELHGFTVKYDPKLHGDVYNMIPNSMDVYSMIPNSMDVYYDPELHGCIV
jgi:hypothetical protein